MYLSVLSTLQQWNMFVSLGSEPVERGSIGVRIDFFNDQPRSEVTCTTFTYLKKNWNIVNKLKGNTKETVSKYDIIILCKFYVLYIFYSIV